MELSYIFLIIFSINMCAIIMDNWVKKWHRIILQKCLKFISFLKLKFNAKSNKSITL